MPRRKFVKSTAAAGFAATVAGVSRANASDPDFTAGMTPDPRQPASWRNHFPALHQQVNGHPLAYFDTAATSLRPQPVIDAVTAFYRGPNANPGATLHTLARRSAELYDAARGEVARFIGASDPLEIVFTRGTSEAINLVAAAWGGSELKPGDEILLTEGEHASNMLPWQLIAERTGAIVRYAAITSDGHVDLESYHRLLSSRTRIAAFSHVSNVVGIVNPIEEMCARARRAGALTLVDAAQSAPHHPLRVQDIDCDFLAFSSHKMCGPMGVGALWARRDRLDALSPYQSGSNMAHDVDLETRHYSAGGLRFGAGTPNVADAIGFAAAVRFLGAIGWPALRGHEQQINTRMLEGLLGIRGLELLGSRRPDEKVGVFAFTLRGWKPADLVTTLDARGIALRAGDLAALPLLKRLGTTTAARASCYLYTTTGEVDRLVGELSELASGTRKGGRAGS